jgi:hypothetical protein
MMSEALGFWPVTRHLRGAPLDHVSKPRCEDIFPEFALEHFRSRFGNHGDRIGRCCNRRGVAGFGVEERMPSDGLGERPLPPPRAPLDVALPERLVSRRIDARVGGRLRQSGRRQHQRQHCGEGRREERSGAKRCPSCRSLVVLLTNLQP